jgi:glycosyltransferase involved in cell wall biosynthesis
VLANSRFTAERARRELSVEAHVLPPLVRPDVYRVSGPGDRVVFVNPHPDKGVEIAFALAERRPDIPFLFVESWPLREDVRQAQLARAACLPNVEWSEQVGDMRSVYARARILLVPSLWEEAWGRIATEAQVSGIPVLASARGGLPESVGPGGLLVDPEASLDEWAGALSRMWDDRATYARLSKAALEHARRPEIQPAAVVMPFRQLVARHAAAG